MQTDYHSLIQWLYMILMVLLPDVLKTAIMYSASLNAQDGFILEM